MYFLHGDVLKLIQLDMFISAYDSRQITNFSSYFSSLPSFIDKKMISFFDIHGDFIINNLDNSIILSLYSMIYLRNSNTYIYIFRGCSQKENAKSIDLSLDDGQVTKKVFQSLVQEIYNTNNIFCSIKIVNDNIVLVAKVLNNNNKYYWVILEIIKGQCYIQYFEYKYIDTNIISYKSPKPQDFIPIKVGNLFIIPDINSHSFGSCILDQEKNDKNNSDKKKKISPINIIIFTLDEFNLVNKIFTSQIDCEEVN